MSQGGGQDGAQKRNNMSETAGTAVKGENVNGNAVRLIHDEFWRQDVEPWCEPVDGALLLNETGAVFMLVSEGDGGDRAAAGYAGGPVHFDPDATEGRTGGMRAAAEPGGDGIAASMRALCAG